VQPERGVGSLSGRGLHAAHGCAPASIPVRPTKFPAESQLAAATLASLCAGELDAVEVLRRLLRRVRATTLARVN
jgi:hypothetical protein